MKIIDYIFCIKNIKYIMESNKLLFSANLNLLRLIKLIKKTQDESINIKFRQELSLSLKLVDINFDYKKCCKDIGALIEKYPFHEAYDTFENIKYAKITYFFGNSKFDAQKQLINTFMQELKKISTTEIK